MMLGGLQLQIKSGTVKPLGRTVIAGTGPLLPLVACQLHRAGAAVAGAYEACGFGRIAKETLALLNKPQLFLDGLGMLAYLKRHGVVQRPPARAHRQGRHRLDPSALPAGPVAVLGLCRARHPRHAHRRGLNMSKKYDIVIVIAGGGVIGASCAYQLSKRQGLKIALIDAKRPGNASHASAGGLWRRAPGRARDRR